MAVADYPPITPYNKGQPGSLPGSDRLYLERELQKILKTFQDILDVLVKIESKVTYP